MKKVLVFGANGFVGKEFCRKLSQDSEYVVYSVAHNGSQDKQHNFYTADITLYEPVHDLIGEIMPDQIINLAGINSISVSNRSPRLAIEANVTGSANILMSVSEICPNSKVLLIGSSEEYGTTGKKINESDKLNPKNIYGLSKLWQENLAQWFVDNRNLNVICTRSFNHTGESQSENAMVASFCKQIAEINKGNKPPIVFTGNLNVERDISDVRDVVSAYQKLLDSDIVSGVYNVCSGRKIRLLDLLKFIIDLGDTKIQIEIDKDRIRNTDASIVWGDNSKLKAAVEWNPQYKLEDTLKRIYAKYSM